MLLPVFFYLDPPYVRTSRRDNTKGYAYEMSDEDHRNLAWLLHRIKGKAIISGYDTRFYRDLYADWHTASTKTMANGQWGATPRLEVVWANFPLPQT